MSHKRVCVISDLTFLHHWLWCINWVLCDNPTQNVGGGNKAVSSLTSDYLTQTGPQLPKNNCSMADMHKYGGLMHLPQMPRLLYCRLLSVTLYFFVSPLAQYTIQISKDTSNSKRRGGKKVDWAMSHAIVLKTLFLEQWHVCTLPLLCTFTIVKNVNFSLPPFLYI